jgi:hypothetical protein
MKELLKNRPEYILQQKKQEAIQQARAEEAEQNDAERKDAERQSKVKAEQDKIDEVKMANTLAILRKIKLK